MRPDIAAYRINHQPDRKTDFSMMDMWIELKPKGYDPFKDPSSNGATRSHKGAPKQKAPADSQRPSFHRSSMKARNVQGQLVAYANAVLCRQFRTRLFSVLISDTYARIILWDNSCAVVTRRFDFISQPKHLAQFFWLYHQLSLDLRGYDPSVTIPDSREQILAKNALRITDDKATFVKLCIPDDRGVLADRSYIAETPPYTPRSPMGRNTRGIVAYDLMKQKVVWIKDYWRIIGPGMEKEGDIYVDLHRHCVPHIPRFERASEIKSNDLCTTSNHRWVHETWACHTRETRTYSLYRLVLGEVGRKLTSFESSWECVNALADALDGMYFLAFIRGRILTAFCSPLGGLPDR
jgi:Fungal protein kinase